MTSARRILRTMVFVPADDGTAARRAVDAGADAVCFDLEDLTPVPRKPAARAVVRARADELAARGVAVMARTNSLASGWCGDDLDAIVGPSLHCVNLPKVESADEVAAYCRLLDAAESRNGVRAGHTMVRPVIETALGIKFAYEIAAASDRVEYMGGVAGGFWGDLGASLGVIPSDDGVESLYLRSKVLVDVRAAGVRFPIGGGVSARTDVDGVRAFMQQNKHLGYTGAHVPNSARIIAAVNEVFTPSPAELDDWQRRLPILEAAERDGRVAFLHEGAMYDTAGLGRIREQLALARRVGLV